MGCLLALMFAGSCAGLIPAAMRLADPMTQRPLDGVYQEDFPLAVVEGDRAWVVMASDAHHLPPPPPGASYLVPPAKVRALQRSLDSLDAIDRGNRYWVLRVEPVAPGQQRVELLLQGDGFWGGVYDATATTATARYRKLTGPGFAFVFGPLALMLNVVLWGFANALFRFARARLRATGSPASSS